ncbi:hypothetical protein FRC17_010034 [Serendipita sp. 399]|nr:hypothetical protein FRC17_010034 [Serendipita sp. 399]
MHVELQQEKETAMIEEYYKWRKIWYPTIVKCIFSMLSCEPYGTDKLRTHGLAIWVSERAEYNQLDVYNADLRDRAGRNKWTKWNPDWWNEATAFKTLCPPNKLRIVAFVAPSFLSYDYEGVSRNSLSSRYPPPRWTFPPESPIKPEVRDLITRTMPFFEPLVTNYSTSGVTDPDDKNRYSHFNPDAWEFLIKTIVEQGWYSEDAKLWRQLIDKLACKDCRGREPVPAEVKSGLAYMSKMHRALVRSFSSTASRWAKPTPSKVHLAVTPAQENLPKGFVATGIAAGVKKKEGVLDLALILSKEPNTSAAACFTRNAFQAAPVIVCQDVLQQTSGRANALIVNSGCANAVTGKQGLKDAWEMVTSTDSLLSKVMKSDSTPKKESHSSLVMSTGVIGQTLPIAKILSAVKGLTPDALDSTPEKWEMAAKAFMTTDTFPKLRARTFELGGKEVRIAGIDKGAGMIHPDMGPASSAPGLHATLLGVIATDAAISPPVLQEALTYAVNRSFNSISVDGEMSTNDTVIVFANGASGMKEIDDIHSPEFHKFQEELTSFAADLAQLVVRDGEGATKFVTVNVRGALTYEDAHQVASRISTSALVKTALYGEDANWGRILAATGSTNLSAPITPNTVSVSFIPTDGSEILPLLKNGEPENVDEDRAKVILQREDLEIRVDLGMGNEQASYWTCDFSHEYVTINGDYRS